MSGTGMSESMGNAAGDASGITDDLNPDASARGGDDPISDGNVRSGDGRNIAESSRGGSLNAAPKSMRVRIAVLGRRNAGKSSLLNALTGQAVSLVSDVAGTTTDPVEKQMEFLPIGPVIFVDTAGTDDVGELGRMRTGRTWKELDSADVAVVACEIDGWREEEDMICKRLAEKKIPYIVALTKADLHADAIVGATDPSPFPGAAAAVTVSAQNGEGMQELHDALVAAVPESLLTDPPILSDLVGEHGLAILVVPVDKQAPKGRLILPQVQTIRDLLDGHSMSLVVQDADLPRALASLKTDPDIVVTDSQAFSQVAKAVPERIPMTSFSILFARFKGDLTELAEGAGAIGRLHAGSRVLIAESCSHHRICDDIGTVKIPRLLHEKIDPEIEIFNCRGFDFPADPSSYDLVIHCGGCMLNRAAMHTRMSRCRSAGVPITNYGMSIAHALGILPRALAPFEGALDAYREGLSS